MKMIAYLMLFFLGAVHQTAWPQQTPDCSERNFLTADGQNSDLTVSQLDAMLEKAQLRSHLESCVQSNRPVVGSWWFSLDLYADGGVHNLRFSNVQFAQSQLGACLSGVLTQRLSGQSTGRAANLEGRLSIVEKDYSVGFTLSGILVDPVSKDSLPGVFQSNESGLVSSCPVGQIELYLRLDPTTEVTSEQGTSSDLPPKEVDACFALENQNEARGNGSRAAHRWRSLQRKVTHCLIALLDGSSIEVQVAAAEALAKTWRFRGRHAIGQAVERLMAGQICAAPDVQRHECVYRSPEDPVLGHALVRMVHAQLTLQSRPSQGILRALAKHPDVSVRLRLIDSILGRWAKGLPEGLHELLADPDPTVRTRAQQVGCLLSDWSSLQSFRKDLTSPVLENRTHAIVNARACAQRMSEEVFLAIEQEKNLALALLMLRSVPATRQELLLKLAGAGLFSEWPVVRYLAIRLLARLEEFPDKLIDQALKREGDPALRQALLELSGQRAPVSLYRVEQLWLQTKQETALAK